MAKRNIIECDRCGDEIRNTRITITDTATDYHGTSRDLCSRCTKAYKRFLNNEDQVGEYIYELVDGPCPHFVPCAGPCTSVWERIER